MVFAIDGVVSRRIYPEADVTCHWLLAPCAVLKERFAAQRVPPGFGSASFEYTASFARLTAVRSYRR